MSEIIDQIKPIFPESPEAAKFVTGISGWVDRDGGFFGNDERLARYSGSTHKKCSCGEVITKNSYCEKCHRSADIERYKSAKKLEWDHKTPLYSDSNDEYILTIDDLINLMEELEITCVDDLRLFICEPNYLSQIEIDYWSDDIPEDGELPGNVGEALDALNKEISKSIAVSWSPGKFAAIINLEVIW